MGGVGGARRTTSGRRGPRSGYVQLAYLIEENVSICFSLDGPADVHDANRGLSRSGCYEAVASNIELFRRLWESRHNSPPVLRAMMTTTRASLSQARRIVETYVGFGITRIAVRPVTRVGRARSSAAVTYSAEEYLTLWKDVVDTVLELRAGGLDVREVFLELILKKLFIGESGYMDLRSPCGATIGQIVYHHDGSIYTCDEGRMVGGDRFRIGRIDEPLARSLLSPTARAVLDASATQHYYCDHCAYQPFCGVCPVLHHADRGALVVNVLEQDRCATFGGMIQHVLEKFATDRVARAEFEAILASAE